MNDIGGKMDLIASTPASMLPGFGPFEQAFIRAVKRFREKKKEDTISVGNANAVESRRAEK